MHKTDNRFIENFKNGFPFLKLEAAAVPGKGIVIMNEEQQKAAEERYEAFDGRTVKFVPASGAASRMFKALFEAREILASGGCLKEGSDAERFLSRIREFPFYNASDFGGMDGLRILDHVIGTGQSARGKEGLDYGSCPKGLILFHAYPGVPGEVRTAFEEHLVEGALYARRKDGSVHIHFTVSPRHEEGFRKILSEVRGRYEKRFGVKYFISFSVQDPATDIIAVNEDNTPFIKEDGRPLYRPGGHGALLKNLNDIDADLVFLKNIDNVVHESFIGDTVRWKKVLAGKLLEVRERIFSYLRRIDVLLAEGREDRVFCSEIRDFLKKECCVVLPYLPAGEEMAMLRKKLDRPLRVCGMVANEGEPGGGPYVIREKDGSTSLQILEAAQLNREDPKTCDMVASATHFNPVDLVCSTVGYDGRKFDLQCYVDPDTGFISEKSYEGRRLKAQELPGLWNGSMSDWNTVFVETPLITFNPVKTVLDLLRKEHCAEESTGR